jgi:hypothetical protein
MEAGLLRWLLVGEQKASLSARLTWLQVGFVISPRKVMHLDIRPSYHCGHSPNAK